MHVRKIYTFFHLPTCCQSNTSKTNKTMSNREANKKDNKPSVQRIGTFAKNSAPIMINISGGIAR